MENLFFNLIAVLIPIIFSVTIHEFSHIVMAKFTGDNLGTKMKRFTLDPFKHIDFIWTIILPVLLLFLTSFTGGFLPVFAAGKPVLYNLNNFFFKKKIMIQKAEFLIAISGPFSNLCMAFILISFSSFLINKEYSSFSIYSAVGLLHQISYLNIVMFIFNIIPIPPFDGYKILLSILSLNFSIKYRKYFSSMSWVLFMLLIIDGGNFIGSICYFIFKIIVACFI